MISMSRARHTIALAAVLLSAVAVPATGAGQTDASLDDRVDVYERFRELYDAGRYEEALPLALRVVELSEKSADSDYELPIAHNNVGATQLQLGQYASAEASYLRSLEILESTQGISSRRLIAPLTGLGNIHAAQDRHEVAAGYFLRALSVSRRADGLFNLAQLPLIELASKSFLAITDYGGAERERLYGLKVVEQNFGYGDPRTLPVLLELARFYESLRQYMAARMMYMRAHDITAKESGGFSPDAIKTLLGIARMHRLQYVTDASFESQSPTRDELTGDVVDEMFRQARIAPPAASRVGLRAAGTALDLLRAATDPPPQLMIDTLIELGDWYQTTSRQGLAYPFYREASAVVAAHPDRVLVNPLAAPRLVSYRPPLAAARGLNAMSGEYRIRRTVFEFAVTESGVPENISIVESDMTEGQLMQSRRALGRAIYAPRFEDGKPVASEGVRFTSEWSEPVQAEGAAAAPQATQKG